VGWLSYTGRLDTCICIRTVVVKDRVAHVQAGGGTVADARPDYEFEESRAKSRAVLEAVRVACRQREWA
jgi:anthranilate synthase component 1